MTFELIKPILESKKQKNLYKGKSGLSATKSRIMQAIKSHLNKIVETGMKNNSYTENMHNNYKMLAQYCTIKQEQETKEMLLDSLRYIVIDEYLKADSKTKSILMYWHSLFHMYFLSRQDDISLEVKVKKWVDMHAETDDIKIHAMRGNFEKLKKVYPECIKMFDELAIAMRKEKMITEHNDSVCMNDMTYLSKATHALDADNENEFNAPASKIASYVNWKKTYQDSIPVAVKDILLGRYNPKNHYWADKLIYKLIFVQANRGFPYDSTQSIEMILSESNIYTKILDNDMCSFFEELDSFLKIAFFFVIHDINTGPSFLNFDYISENFDKTFKECINTDLELSLLCLPYNLHFDLYYNYLLHSADLDDEALMTLLKFTLKNGLDTKKIMSRYISLLMNERNYVKLFAFLQDFRPANVTLDFTNTDFGYFCLTNYSMIKETLTMYLHDTEFQTLINFVHNHEYNETDMYTILHTKYFRLYHPFILDNIIGRNMTYIVCLKVLDKIFELECKEISLPDHYKQMILIKMISQVNVK